MCCNSAGLFWGEEITISQGYSKFASLPEFFQDAAWLGQLLSALGNDGFALLPELCINELSEELLTLTVATEQTLVDIQQEPRAWVDE